MMINYIAAIFYISDDKEVKYSKCLKTELFWNPNFSEFGFQTIQISNILDLY